MRMAVIKYALFGAGVWGTFLALALRANAPFGPALIYSGAVAVLATVVLTFSFGVQPRQKRLRFVMLKLSAEAVTEPSVSIRYSLAAASGEDVLVETITWELAEWRGGGDGDWVAIRQETVELSATWPYGEERRCSHLLVLDDSTFAAVVSQHWWHLFRASARLSSPGAAPTSVATEIVVDDQLRQEYRAGGILHRLLRRSGT